MNATTPMTREQLDALDLETRQDHLRMLAHACANELLELIRLRDKLVERGGKIVPLDCLKFLDTIEALEDARRRYAHAFRRYDAPQIIFQAAEAFAGDTIAQVIENSMTAWRERLMAEASASLEKERAAKG